MFANFSLRGKLFLSLAYGKTICFVNLVVGFLGEERGRGNFQATLTLLFA